ncbi:MAG TPA: DUF1573 domain-containing protein [Gemmatales bacterium]|nr:DUF1573 domain-containing protein [Gemmatales bacterium]HMP60934.1 DUF1573 domain-containing protein [Gemmatales bacterium]
MSLLHLRVSILLLVLFPLGLLAGCQLAVPAGPSGASNPVDKGSFLPLTCKEPVWDFGEVITEKVEHAFELYNENSKPVTIKAIGKSCGCTEVTLSARVVPPREAVRLTITRRNTPKVLGELFIFREEFLIHLDESDVVTKLMIEGSYLPECYYTKLAVPIKAPSEVGTAFEGTFDLMVNPATELEIKSVRMAQRVGATRFECDPPQVHPARDGGFTRLEFRVHGVMASKDFPQEAVLEIETSASEYKTIRVPAILVEPVVDRVQVHPDRFSFGLLKPGYQPVRRTVTIRLPNAKALELVRFESSLEGITVQREAPASGQALLRVTAELPAGVEPGQLAGTVRLVLASGEKTLEVSVPVSGYVNGK